ncbi:MAG: pyruvate dehydrogenase (acetyl-transferring) E1 component subunit alpha [Nitrospinota bacterium]|nr:MAG: pyruvate dehydrogenase (acetyl-transferring) E1 component subunit alpha [Nitrospinota bacterium]
MDLSKEKLLEMYRTMLKIRIFEETALYESSRGNVQGALHLYIGEEAVAVGVCANLRKEDYITSTHRGHGHCIAKGADVKRMMAELFGKVTGYCKGKGGSMHIADFSIGMLGANGIVAGGIGMATGAALAIQMRKTDQVTVCFFGDGAANRGPFHEGLNMAAVWKLPVVFVCENNRYAQWTPQEKVTLVTDIADMAVAYGMPGVSVDGMDVMAVYETAHQAISRARRGEGPTLVECKTYRFHGHSLGDAQQYRSKEEVAEWSKRDPIKLFQAFLQDKSLLTEAEAKQIEESVRREIEEAVEFASSSPFPPPEEVFEDVVSKA